MKTIFRSTIAAIMFAALIALGAVAGFAQDPCADVDGQTALDAKFRANYPAAKSPDERKIALEAGKTYLEKYGSCESTKQFSDYLKGYLPKLETSIKNQVIALRLAPLEASFLAGMKSKNWDDVYNAGEQLLAEDADKYRDVELALGSIGLDETLKSPRVTKWNDKTLRWAKQSIADLEGNKTFKPMPGVFVTGGADFHYKDKVDAIAWMNYTVGLVLSADKNNKKEGAVYLYKASQAASDTKSNPVVFQWIGAYYFDDAKKLISDVESLAKEVKALEESVKPTDTPEVKQQKVDAAKAKADIFKTKEGILNGTVERALDAYSRAYALAPDTPAGKAYRDGIFKTLGDLYSVRFAKTDGLEAYIKAIPSKPLPDPSTPITPVIDPEPSATADTPAAVPTTTVKPGTPAAKPATKPGTVGKPQSVSDAAKTDAATTATTAKPAAKAVVKKKGTK
jgi:hypothetical protein